MGMSAATRFGGQGEVAEIWLATGREGNALDGKAIRDLTQRLRDAQAAPDCRAIVLQAAADDFCAGLDVEFAVDAPRDAIGVLCSDFSQCLETIATSAQPVIAAVAGKASGGGVGLLAACDIVLATPSASFQLPEVLMGMVPTLVTPFLARRISYGKIGYLALATPKLTAQKAHELGLVDELAPCLERAIQGQLRRLLSSSPAALAEAKAWLAACASRDAHRHDPVERAQRWLLRQDVASALEDFTQGRVPSWFSRSGRVER